MAIAKWSMTAFHFIHFHKPHSSSTLIKNVAKADKFHDLRSIVNNNECNGNVKCCKILELFFNNAAQRVNTHKK